MDTIKRINREALRQAQEAEKNYHLICYAVAALVVVAAYFVLRSYKPSFVLTRGPAGEPVLDQTKLILSAIGAGLVVVLVYHFFF